MSDAKSSIAETQSFFFTATKPRIRSYLTATSRSESERVRRTNRTMSVQAVTLNTIDLAAIKSQQQVAWGSGDYTI